MICTQCTHVILYYIVRCDDRQDQVGWYGNAVLSHSSPFLSFLMLIRTFRWWLGHNFDIVIWASVLFLFSGSPCGAPHHVGGHLQDGPRLGDVRLAGGRLHLPALLGPRDRLHAPAHAPPHRPLRWGHSDLQILPPRARRSLWRECSACVQYEWCGRGRIREGCYAWQDHFPHPQLTLKPDSLKTVHLNWLLDFPSSYNNACNSPPDIRQANKTLDKKAGILPDEFLPSCFRDPAVIDHVNTEGVG